MAQTIQLQVLQVQEVKKWSIKHADRPCVVYISLIYIKHQDKSLWQQQSKGNYWSVGLVWLNWQLVNEQHQPESKHCMSLALLFSLNVGGNLVWVGGVFKTTYTPLHSYWKFLHRLNQLQRIQTIDQRIVNCCQSSWTKLQYLHILLHSQRVMNHKQVWAPAASLEMFLSPMSAVTIGTPDGVPVWGGWGWEATQQRTQTNTVNWVRGDVATKCHTSFCRRVFLIADS